MNIVLTRGLSPCEHVVGQGRLTVWIDEREAVVAQRVFARAVCGGRPWVEWSNSGQKLENIRSTFREHSENIQYKSFG